MNLTFHLHFLGEAYPVSQFNDNPYSIKKLTERKEQNVSVLSIVLISNDAVLSKTLLRFAYQEIYSEYIFINTERVDRRWCQDFCLPFFLDQVTF